MLAAFLLQCGAAPTATAALELFGRERTHDGKGVTIPSQMRYVHYYEALLRAPDAAAFAPATYRLRHIRLHGVPNFDLHGGCDPFFDVRVGDGKAQIFDWLTAHKRRIPHFQPKSTHYIDLDVSPFDVRVRGDVKVVFYDYDLLSDPDKMFHFWFNTGFITNNYLLFHKTTLDGACKDKACKAFESSFKVEVFLDRLDDDISHAAVDANYLEADEDRAWQRAPRIRARARPPPPCTVPSVTSRRPLARAPHPPSQTTRTRTRNERARRALAATRAAALSCSQRRAALATQLARPPLSEPPPRTAAPRRAASQAPQCRLVAARLSERLLLRSAALPAADAVRGHRVHVLLLRRRQREA